MVVRFFDPLPLVHQSKTLKLLLVERLAASLLAASFFIKVGGVCFREHDVS